MRLRLELAASVPKEPDQPNEDHWAADSALGRFALSDGATVSYASSAWASLLVERFVQAPHIDSLWIEQAGKAHTQQMRSAMLHTASTGTTSAARPPMPWEEASIEKGSWATLVAVELFSEVSRLEVFAIGDSVAMLVRDNHVVSTHAIQSADEFDSWPEMLGSRPGTNEAFKEPEFDRKVRCNWSVAAGDRVFLLTDALAAWVLGNLSAASVESLNNVTDEAGFADLVAELRRDVLKVDDTTMLRLAVEADQAS